MIDTWNYDLDPLVFLDEREHYLTTSDSFASQNFTWSLTKVETEQHSDRLVSLWSSMCKERLHGLLLHIFRCERIVFRDCRMCFENRSDECRNT